MQEWPFQPLCANEVVPIYSPSNTMDHRTF